MSVLEALPISEPVRTTAPTSVQEPLTIEEARRQCGLGSDNAYHDPDLADLIAAARAQVEHDTGIVCYTGEFTYKLTEWPDTDWFPLVGIRPVTAVAITYLDANGTSQTFAAANYTLQTAAVKPFIRLNYAANWPVVRGDYHGITITATAGYATVQALPPAVKTAVKLALLVQWLLKMQDAAEADRQQVGYERWLWNIPRASYP